MQVQLIILNTITSTRGLELPSTWWAFASAGIYTGQKSHRLDSPKYKAPICDYPHKKRNRIKLWNSLLFLLKPLVALAWTLSTAAGLAIVYGMTPYVDESKVPEISSAVSMTYGTLHRTAWAFVIEWIIFACSRGYGGKSTENHFLIKYLPLYSFVMQQVLWIGFCRGRDSYRSAGWLIAFTSSTTITWLPSIPP